MNCGRSFCCKSFFYSRVNPEPFVTNPTVPAAVVPNTPLVLLVTTQLMQDQGNPHSGNARFKTCRPYCCSQANEGSEDSGAAAAHESALVRPSSKCKESFGVCLTGVHHVGLLGEEGLWRAAAGCQAFISSYIRHPQQQECFHLSGWDQKTQRPAGNDIGEELSRAQTLKEQLQKLQEEFYHLHWSIKDVTERALHEALKQSKLPGFSGLAVQEVINQVLEKLEESQVPVTDYALRSSGAAVIPECTSPSFRNRAEKVILYSLPLVDYVRSPELILEKENHLGNCWPFHGSQGHVLIKLSVPVIPRAVTMDHVSGPELHGDSMSSAPKDFAVYGVTEEKEEQFLGQFVFLAPLNPTQTFRLKNELSGFVNYILLQVLSNWGHPDYTCVYRFRVHGDPLSEEGKVPLRSDNKAP
ncbi:SUN domain-containing protein 3-like [Pezoporus flaviventris]|uniref:SUN domain-containing protein 3-like n=1 Tax=Pezoporus flaviventris TaxID=889875 RepID=UPI002AB011B5|nr:SUN domain-containing protein 3-like [Pezoporus flaviventris]